MRALFTFFRATPVFLLFLFVSQLEGRNTSYINTNTPTAPPSTPPALASPTGLSGTVDGSSHMNLTWAASTGATSYLVERETLATGVWSNLATATGTTYQDTGYGTGGYHYRVSAVHASVTSAPGNEWPQSRYAVIDLGVNKQPMKITSGKAINGGSANPVYVLMKDSTSGNNYDVWSNGTLTTLQPDSATANTGYGGAGWIVSDIGEDGKVAGLDAVPASRLGIPSPYCDFYDGSGGASANDNLMCLAIWSPGATTPTLTAPSILNTT